MNSLKELLDNSKWAADLAPAQRQRVEKETKTRRISAGGYLCRKGEGVEHWMGVISGLVKIVVLGAEGKETTITGVTPGAWFGEGSLLKNEPRRYDAIALRDSAIAYMPKSTFMWLLDASIKFNRFLLVQLNERLSQTLGLFESDRLQDPDTRVAHCLATLYNPHLYPGTERTLVISQEEIAHFAGLSRPRVNSALKALQTAGLLRVDYGGITVLNLDGLRQYRG